MALSVLIVDDSRLSRQIVKKSLPDWEMVIREASGGRECLELYEEQRADFVLLDLTMPEMDGFETLERLLEMDPEARVVVITADIQAGSKDRVMELGGLALLHKPVKEEELEAVLEELLA